MDPTQGLHPTAIKIGRAISFPFRVGAFCIFSCILLLCAALWLGIILRSMSSIAWACLLLSLTGNPPPDRAHLDAMCALWPHAAITAFNGFFPSENYVPAKLIPISKEQLFWEVITGMLFLSGSIISIASLPCYYWAMEKSASFLWYVISTIGLSLNSLLRFLPYWPL